jgi:hypothetical protein
MGFQGKVNIVAGEHHRRSSLNTKLNRQGRGVLLEQADPILSRLNEHLNQSERLSAFG